MKPHPASSAFSSSPLQHPFQILPRVQNYLWGKKGDASLVAQLHGASDPNQPYAELWFGAHANAPSCILQKDRLSESTSSLRELVKQFPKELLGDKIVEKFGLEIPFLIKVLSVRTALSIQAHPDAALAKLLHKADPKHYPDPFHKPELGIALTPVSLLYGFRSATEIQSHLRSYPEFQILLGEQKVSQYAEQLMSNPSTLKALYHDMLCADEQRVAQACVALFHRLQTKPNLTPEETFAVALQKEFPHGDVGFFSLWLLNLVRLAPGEAMFVEPSTAHAYLQGELFECMACSDNVIRAGFTSKHKDVEALVSMLDYNFREPQRVNIVEQSGVLTYQTPAHEFAVTEIRGGSEHSLKNDAQLKMIFCLEGQVDCVSNAGNASYSLPLHTGQAAIVPAQTQECQLRVQSGRAFFVSVPTV